MEPSPSLVSHAPTHLFKCHGQPETLKVHGENFHVGLDALATQLGIIRHVQIGLHILVQLVPVLNADKSVHLHQNAGDAVGGIETIQRGGGIVVHGGGLQKIYGLAGTGSQ